MDRRNFLMDFSLWLLSFGLGYKSGLFGAPTVLGEDSDALSKKMNFLEKQASRQAKKLTAKVSVLQFGAIGDDHYDNTSAFQAAFDYAFQHNKEIELPNGVFRIYGQLKLPKNISILGTNATLEVYTDAKKNCVVKTYHKEPFTLSSNTDTTLYLKKVYFQNAYEGNKKETTLFKNVFIRGSNIENNTFDNYGTVFYGGITYVSFVHHNHFVSIHRFLFDGQGKSGKKGAYIIDSYIHHNYINGKPDANSTAFRIETLAMSSIHHNFIDFFKYCFDFTNYSQGSVIESNVLDYSFCGMRMAGGTLNQMVITKNTFRNISKKASLKVFPQADQMMKDGNWIGIDTFGGRVSSVKDNIVISCDTFLYAHDYAFFQFKVGGNLYESTPVKVRYAAYKSNLENDQEDVYIEELDELTHSTLPNPGLTGNVVSFNGQKAYYQGKYIYNANGQWKDMMGNIVSSSNNK